MAVLGLHHITAFASDPRENLRFYRDVLGLRLVKKTVNFDAPTMYHLYFGDEGGQPGTLITFFPRPTLAHGEVGAGQVGLSCFSVPIGSLDFWADRIATGGGMITGREGLFGEERLLCADPDGLRFALVAQRSLGKPAYAEAGIAEEHAIQGLCGVSLYTQHGAHTEEILTTLFGYTPRAQKPLGEGRIQRMVPESGPAHEFVDLITDPVMALGAEGAGIVHHVAFRIANGADQKALREQMLASGLTVTDVRDRDYFTAIYSRTEDGILFEVATDPPGFAVDEPAERLGQRLCLPQMHESKRGKLEERLIPLD